MVDMRDEPTELTEGLDITFRTLMAYAYMHTVKLCLTLV
jgi:hypothetical protein